MKRTLLALLLGLSCTLTGCQHTGQQDSQDAPHSPAQGHTATMVTHGTGTRCQEDQPCWDCRTMGNGICGRP